MVRDRIDIEEGKAMPRLMSSPAKYEARDLLKALKKELE